VQLVELYGLRSWNGKRPQTFAASLEKKLLPRRALRYTKENLRPLPRSGESLPRRIKKEARESQIPRLLHPGTDHERTFAGFPSCIFVSFAVNCFSGVRRRGHHGHRDLRRVHRVRHLDADAGHHHLRQVGHRVLHGLRRGLRSVQDDRPQLAAQVRRG